MHRPQDIAIQLAIQTHRSVGAIEDGYSKLLPLLDLEHELIRTSSLAELEQLTITKNALGDAITAAYEDVLRHWDRARSLCQLGNEGQRGSIAELIDNLKLLGTKQSFSSLESGVFDKAINNLEQAYERLKSTRKLSLPKIEMNYYLAQKLLRHHQESHRFWQELARESSSTYTAEGTVAKTQDATSVFRAKA
jgi:hypothetical protein